MRTFKITGIMLFGMLSLPLQADDATAAGWESNDRIRSTAARFVAEQSAPTAKIEAAALDQRLRLPSCPQPLRASAPNPASRGTWSVSVLCELGAGAGSLWSIFVPVRVADFRPVVVLVRPLAPNQPITADAVALESRDIATLSFGYISDPAQAIGQMLRRPMSPGATLTPDAIAAQKLIKRGALITIVGKVGGLEVRAQGKALGEGGGGERISVENVSSHRIVEGVIRDSGNVEVGL
jgi:flagella basal body P-ring formation protein FlgA